MYYSKLSWTLWRITESELVSPVFVFIPTLNTYAQCKGLNGITCKTHFIQKHYLMLLRHRTLIITQNQFYGVADQINNNKKNKKYQVVRC